jgi:hypothetical protein
VDLFVTAGDAQYLACTGRETAVAECMADGIREFGTVYSRALLGPSKEPVPVPADTAREGGGTRSGNR